MRCQRSYTWIMVHQGLDAAFLLFLDGQHWLTYTAPLEEARAGAGEVQQMCDAWERATWGHYAPPLSGAYEHPLPGVPDYRRDLMGG